MSQGVLHVRDLPPRLLGGCSVLLNGESVVSYHYGLTPRRARRNAFLAMARIMEKDLTARYRP